MIHIYRTVFEAEQPREYAILEKILKANNAIGLATDCSHNSFNLRTEICFNIELVKGAVLTTDETEKLFWLCSETFQSDSSAVENSFLDSWTETDGSRLCEWLVEIGPRLTFATAWSSNCASICKACNILSVERIERSRRIKVISEHPLSQLEKELFISKIHDRMTECIYHNPLTTFEQSTSSAEAVTTIPIISEGSQALEELNKAKGLGFDSWDIDYYTSMFINKLQRNPTDVEAFDLAQSNSEHSRHWFFGGKMIIDAAEKEKTLFQLVKATLPQSSNSVIAFHDNSSALHGYEVSRLAPQDPTRASALERKSILLHPILTAETHNFPCAVAPFPGAETGTGGRLRDVQATGRGAHTLAGISAYCVGNLRIPHNPMPWEQKEGTGVVYASNLATPLEIEVEASNGASDYGNKYGEPVIAGFTRSFGQTLPSGERVEWIKPVMFTAGIGLLDARHSVKGQPDVGMVVCKIGGPAYRIGMGGGAASSRVQGSKETAQLDFNAVQRGDAEMENRMNRVIRACVEMGEDNPIVSIHDQGAGGNGNVLKEIVDPLGAKFDLRSIPVGDKTLSVMEIWGAEYQENNAILVRPEHLPTLLAFAQRENCPVTPVGEVTGDGRVLAVDSRDGSVPFDLPLSLVLGKMPQKEFRFSTPQRTLLPLRLPEDVSLDMALERVLRLLDVGSKRFLTNKVDRSVTGLIAQQQCVGPLHSPLSDVAVCALSHFSLVGVATSVGEQPIKGLISSEAQARMTVGEALSNLVFAEITQLSDVKASCNWMWAAKMEGEGAKMYAACEALCDVLIQLGPSIDGGKDSLSMAARVENEMVKSPGEVTLTCYAPCPDITKTITPNFKYPDIGQIVYVNLAGKSGKRRIGGSALSTVFGQLGDEAADMDDVDMFKRCFNCIQTLIKTQLIVSGHDVSDGGMLVAILEMAFAGNCGLSVSIQSDAVDVLHNVHTQLGEFFAEELGFILEVLPQNVNRVLEIFKDQDVPASCIGQVQLLKDVKVGINGTTVLDRSMCALRDIYESTSFSLELLQCNHQCVAQERDGLKYREGPAYKMTFDVSPTSDELLFKSSAQKHRVAVIRQEGSNGDREMLSAFHAAGFEAWDVNMQDLISGNVQLNIFRGVAFCGGFSYADVNDSAKGWAGSIKFNPSLLSQFNSFRDRKDTFSLGVCNGCQLMALMGWVPFPAHIVRNSAGGDVPFDPSLQTRFIHNSSGRYESRWVAVKILDSPAVLLKGMEDSTLGVWLAHGEGKVIFPDPQHSRIVQEQSLAPLRYVDDSNTITETYPMNPNGSPLGIAALCSQDGRHLAMMPHPERCFLKWQMPHMPNSWKSSLTAAPWLRMFQNARQWCDSL